MINAIENWGIFQKLGLDFSKTSFQCPPSKSIVSQMFLKIQRMSEHQFTKELNFRRFEKTRNGGIISDVLKTTTLPSF
ncbi:MAG: hypothetical protein P1P61_05485, partial [Treponemataceae bacterium]